MKATSHSGGVQLEPALEQTLANFYEKEANKELDSVTCTPPSLEDGEEILAEWRVFKKALTQEKKIECDDRDELSGTYKRYNPRDIQVAG